MAVIRIESSGSFWMIDEDRMVYMRMPKTEGPRDKMLFEGSPWLDDLVWHPFTSWNFTPRWDGDGQNLRIMPPGAINGIVAPHAFIKE